MMYFLLGLSVSANAFCLYQLHSINKRIDELDEIMNEALEESLENMEEELETWQSVN